MLFLGFNTLSKQTHNGEIQITTTRTFTGNERQGKPFCHDTTLNIRLVQSTELRSTTGFTAKLAGTMVWVWQWAGQESTPSVITKKAIVAKFGAWGYIGSKQRDHKMNLELTTENHCPLLEAYLKYINVETKKKCPIALHQSLLLILSKHFK